MALAAGDDEVAFGVDLATGGGRQHPHEAGSAHVGRWFDAARLAQGGAEVHEVHEVVDDAAGLDHAWPPHRQRDLAADVVQVVLRSGDARDAVVARHHDDRVVVLARLGQFLDQDAKTMVEGEAFAQVVGDVFANLVDIGHEARHPALEVVGIDIPQGLARAALPRPMRVGRAPPVAERPVGSPREHERPDVVARLGVEQLLGRLDAVLGPESGHEVGELVEVEPGLVVGRAHAAHRGIAGLAGAPHLVGVTDLVAAASFEFEREGGDVVVPVRAHEDGAETGLPEVAASEHRAPARRAGRSRNERVGEQRALRRDRVEVRCLDQVVPGAGAVDPAVRAGVATPVVRECDHDVRLHSHPLVESGTLTNVRNLVRRTMGGTPAAVGGWKLRLQTTRGEETPVVALAADGTGVYQSPEGLLGVEATYDGDDVVFIVTHKTVMTDFKIRFKGTVSGDTFDGGMMTVIGPHPVTGERILETSDAGD